MSPEEAPVGTIVIIGHVANNVTATKQENGLWLDNLRSNVYHNSEEVGRAGHAIHIPQH